MKAQSWSIDLALSVLIFISLISIFLFNFNNFTNDAANQRSLSSMQDQSLEVTETLIRTKGFPNDWNITTVKSVGLANRQNVLNNSKIEEFLAVDYNLSRSRMGIWNYEYFTIMEHLNKSIVYDNPGLVGLWHLNRDPSIGRVIDLSGNMLDGVPSSFPPSFVKTTTPWSNAAYGFKGRPTSVVDSENGNDLSNIGASWEGNPANCKLGSCLSFDGVSSYLYIDNPSLSTDFPSKGGGTATEMTITAWIYMRSGSGQRRGIASKQTDPNRGFVFMVEGDDKLTFESWSLGLFSFTVTSDNSLNLDRWYHVGVTVDADGLTDIYVDGQGLAGGPQTGLGMPDSNAVDFDIGRYYWDFGSEWYFDGLIDDVRVFSRSLSDTEIQGIFDQETTEISGEVSRWKFDDILETQYVQVQDNPLLNPQNITISVWFNSTDLSGGTQTFVSKGNGGQYYVGVTDSLNMVFGLNTTNGGFQEHSFAYGPSFSEDIWFHVVVTYNGSFAAAFVNGVFLDSSPLITGEIAPTNGEGLLIGTENDNLLNPVSGQVDEVVIWNRELSNQEIADLHNSYLGGEELKNPWKKGANYTEASNIFQIERYAVTDNFPLRMRFLMWKSKSI